MRNFFIAIILFANLSVYGQGQTTMVNIKGGFYLPLYSLDSQKIVVKPFLMDIYPVTNMDYKKFVLQFPDWRKSKIKSIYADTNYLHHWTSDTNFNALLAFSPVVNVSWFAAKKYCEQWQSGSWLGRLMKPNQMQQRT